MLMVRKLLAKKPPKIEILILINKCHLVINVAECQATISITVHSALSRPFVGIHGLSYQCRGNCLMSQSSLKA